MLTRLARRPAPRVTRTRRTSRNFLLTAPRTRVIFGRLVSNEPAAAHEDEVLAATLLSASAVPRCSWCGRYAVEETWRRFRTEQAFLHDLAAKKPTHTICDDCVRNLRERGLSH